MDLRLVRYVVVVAEERHFGRAAERVHLTQPGLSQATQRLERELGFDIFVRSSRSVELTDAGRVFLDEAIVLLEQADRMLESARAVANGDVGELQLGYSPSIRATAARLLAEFSRGRPGLSITHRQEYTLPLIAAVEKSKTLDAAIVISQKLSPQLTAEPLGSVPLVCLVERNHPLGVRSSATLAEIAEHPIAIVDAPSVRFWRTFLIGLFERDGLSPTFVNEADPVSAELPMPSHGLVWLVSSELSKQPSHEVELVPPEWVPFDVVWRRDRESPALSAFLDHVRADRNAGQTAAVKSAGRRSQPRRAPAPARSGLG